MSAAAEPEVIIRKDGRAGRITMNRPKALNALTLGMVRAMQPALEAWAQDAAVELVILDAVGGKALCAGGDVRSLYDAAPRGSGAARDFWREEYRLDATIHRYRKPFVALMDGIVMGGGIGISAHARGGTRIVTERSQLAMPETSIGLIPDVGGTWLLAHAPGEVGVYLGLIGERMRGAGTIFSGFADRFVESAKLPDLVARLCDTGAAGVEPALAAFATPPPASDLAAHAALIDRLFAHDRVEAIRDALAREPGEWAAKTLAAIDVRSPLALKATLAAIRSARALPSLEAALNREFALCTRLYEHGEFIEGVRALIVDKDKAPKWRPPSLGEVTPAMLADILAPLPASEALDLRAP